MINLPRGPCLIPVVVAKASISTVIHCHGSKVQCMSDTSPAAHGLKDIEETKIIAARSGVSSRQGIERTREREAKEELAENRRVVSE